MAVLCCVNAGAILHYKMHGHKYLIEVAPKKGRKVSCCLLSIRVFFLSFCLYALHCFVLSTQMLHAIIRIHFIELFLILFNELNIFHQVISN